MSARRERLKRRFFELALEKIGRMTDAWEQGPEQNDALTEALRDAHTMKGEARMLGFDAVGHLAHAAEDLMVAAREDPNKDTARSEQFYRVMDALRSVIDGEGESSVAIDALVAEVLDQAPPATPPSGRPKPVPAAQSRQPKTNAAPEAASKAAATTGGQSRSGSTTGKHAQIRRKRFVRVSAEELDRLTAIVADLTASRQRTEATLEVLQQDVSGSLDALRGALSDLEAGAISDVRSTLATMRREQEALLRFLRSNAQDAFEEQLHIEDLEHRLAELRLVPLATLFEELPAAARTLARELGRTVRVESEHTDVQIDRTVLERIREPLVHAIRNAVDHGLEGPNERVAAGKAPAGRLKLSAARDGRLVRITVSDDGRGIDVDAVRWRALEQGLITPGTQLVESDVIHLVMMPGFSTRTEISEVSGRGVGLDALAETARSLGGTLNIESEVGRGTTLTIRVPTSVLNAPVLVVRCGAVTLGVPSARVLRCASFDRSRLEQASETPQVRVEGALHRLVPLAEVVGEESGEAGSLVIVAHGNEAVALLVDQIVGEQHISQRPLDPLIEKIGVVQAHGRTLDGETVLTLDVDAIADPGVGTARRRIVEVRSTRRVLVVDDSEVTRDMIVSALLRHGYEVAEAVDGRDALQRLRDDLPDVLFSDIEMPVMSGLDLIREVRADAELSELPIVVFSGRGSENDRKQASLAGADAYIVKAGFEERAMLDVLSRLLGEE